MGETGRLNKEIAAHEFIQTTQKVAHLDLQLIWLT